jgi:hypothetical protein
VTERLAAAGIEASVGSRGDASTLAWVAWFNTCRMLEHSTT